MMSTKFQTAIAAATHVLQRRRRAGELVSCRGQRSSQTAGEECRLALEVIRSPVMGSSSKGGPPFTFSVFRCIRRAALSFFFCERANSF